MVSYKKEFQEMWVLAQFRNLVFDTVPEPLFPSLYNKEKVIYDFSDSFQLRQAQILTLFGKIIAFLMCMKKSYHDPLSFSSPGSWEQTLLVPGLAPVTLDQ